MARRQNLSPSDFSVFAMQVYDLSATYLDFQTFLEIYSELLHLVWWNPDIDLPLAVEERSKLNSSGVVLRGKNGNC